MKENGWKVVLLVVLLAAAAYFGASSFRGTSPVRGLPAEIPYVCVETGEVFYIPRGDADVPPRLNPKTGRRTLLSIYDEENAFFVDERYRSVLVEMGELNKCVDIETMKVTDNGE